MSQCRWHCPKLIAECRYIADFQLVVEFNPILHPEGDRNSSIILKYNVALPNSEGAQFTPATLETLTLIDAFDHQQLIVVYVNTNPIRSLFFGEECSAFCEG